MFSVDLWGSHPDEGNDDCWTGIDFDSLDDARAFLLNPVFPAYCGDPSGTAYFLLSEMVSGDSESQFDTEYHPNPLFNAAKRDAKRRMDDASDRSEYMMQAGMGFGCDGYNDAGGY